MYHQLTKCPSLHLQAVELILKAVGWQVLELSAHSSVPAGGVCPPGAALGNLLTRLG